MKIPKSGKQGKLDEHFEIERLPVWVFGPAGKNVWVGGGNEQRFSLPLHPWLNFP